MDLWGSLTITTVYAASPAACIREGITEAEHLVRNAYVYPERQDGTWFRASNDTVTVGEAGPGSMAGVWQGEDGDYTVSITFYDEAIGQAWMGFSVNNVLLDSWTGNKQNGIATHTLSGTVHLSHGDQLRIDFYTQRKMRCLIDCMEIRR